MTETECFLLSEYMDMSYVNGSSLFFVPTVRVILMMNVECRADWQKRWNVHTGQDTLLKLRFLKSSFYTGI